MDAEKRGEVYRSLSRLYRLPDERISAQITELTVALEAIYPEAAELLASLGNEIDIEQLKIDFARLFVGPFKLLAPPYGSVYLESGRRVMGVSTIDARNRYRAAGLDFTDNLKEAPDHIAFELEFMYYLIFKETEARAQSDSETAADFLDKQKAFLLNHLGAWVWDFGKSVERHANTKVYELLARVTSAFVQKDKAALLRESASELAPDQFQLVD